MRVLPAGSLDDVLLRLDEVVDESVGEGSRRAYFACLYRGVTRRVKEAVQAGRFDDGPRMERLDVLFANRYLSAYTAFRERRPLTRSWRAAFQAAGAWRLLVLQHLLLGMNAHINLDLGVAAAATSPGRQLPSLERDFHEITVLLGEMLEEVQDRLSTISPWMRLLDKLGCRTDEAIFTFGLKRSRDLAWRTAVHLAALDPDGAAREIDMLDRAVAVLAMPIHNPGPRLSTLLLLARLREPNEVARVVEALG